uniref:Uncharacterized protein n=1 Tax=Octopus bimaculoides TaxID=37653 RepID=A0A0L8HLZ2_OCTBM
MSDDIACNTSVTKSSFLNYSTKMNRISYYHKPCLSLKKKKSKDTQKIIVVLDTALYQFFFLKRQNKHRITTTQSS